MKLLGVLGAAAWIALTVPSCAIDEGTGSSAPCEPSCVQGSGGNGPGRNDGALIVETSPPADSGPSRNILCGTTGCFPGNRSACGNPPTGDAAFGYPFADAGDSAEDDGSNGDAEAGSDAGPGEASSDAGTDASDAPSDTGEMDEPRVAMSCYIQPGQPNGIVTQCGAVGTVPEGGACEDSSECVALDACVEVDKKPVCRPVQCALPPACPAGTFYDQEATLRVAGKSTNLRIPVCLPNDRCTPLTTPNPCLNGEVCAILGSRGETSCVKPGMGKTGDACDETKRCGAGLLCSKFNNQCVRLCHTDAPVNECVGGVCQGGNNALPKNFGICVGELQDASR